MLRSPGQPLPYGCNQNSSQHLRFIQHTKARRYRHPHPTLNDSCTASTVCNCFNAFGDTVAISSQVPRTTAICCAWPWAYWLLWFSSHRLSWLVINPNRQKRDMKDYIGIQPNEPEVIYTTDPQQAKETVTRPPSSLEWFLQISE